MLNFNEYLEYRKGSEEYGQIIHDIMLLLQNERIKKNKTKIDNVEKSITHDDIILTADQLKNIDMDKLKKLAEFNKNMNLISFDITFLDNGSVLFHNLDNIEKETRPFIKEKTN